MSGKRLALLTAVLSGIALMHAQDDNTNKLWYGKPASTWLEALPVGNSHIGVPSILKRTGGRHVSKVHLKTVSSARPVYVRFHEATATKRPCQPHSPPEELRQSL